MKRALSGLPLALLVATLPAARADTTIYSSGTYTGGTYDVISQVYGVIDLEGGAILNTQAGGSVLGSGQQQAYAIELNSGQVNNYGATIAGGAYSNSAAYGISISGGSVNLYGGSLQAGTARLDHDLDVNHGAVNIYGSGFNYALGPISTSDGTLTGTLADGTPFDWTFAQIASGEIVLIPEPSGRALLVLGLLALIAKVASRSERQARLSPV